MTTVTVSKNPASAHRSSGTARIDPACFAHRFPERAVMLHLVDVGELTIQSYRGTAPEHILDDVGQAAEGLRGARVLHPSATPYGGGVSELLRSIVPLLNDLGLISDSRLQKSIREAFGLVVAESLWKAQWMKSRDPAAP